MENMAAKYGDFRDLEVWQLCKSIRDEIWNLCKSFPKEEKYRLSDQMIRSSRSATDCIAEGYGRYHYQENIQFCRQARGSMYELMNQLDTQNTGFLSTCSDSIKKSKSSCLVRMFVT
jgi:four helix bundle protein